MHPLVDRFSAARKLCNRSPFFVVPDSAAVPVTCTNVKQVRNYTRLQDLARLLE